MKCLLCNNTGMYRNDTKCQEVFCKLHYRLIVRLENKSDLLVERTKRDMDHKHILQEYVNQKDLIREAEKRMKELQFAIKQFAEVDDVFELEDAKVTYTKGRVSYKYSDETADKEKELKEIKKLEEQNGVAEAIEGEPYLVVKFTKD